MSTNEELQCGLKITPPKLHFRDAEKGQKNKIDITIQNFSKKAKSVRLRGPETENFVLRAPSEEQLLPSGLVIHATLQFTCNEEGNYEDSIVVFVDNNTVTLPIFVYPPKPVLEFKTPLSFGISIPDGLVLTRHVDITNNGKRAGNFRIDYGGDQPIKIFPCVGTIEPGSFRSIKIEFTSSTLGTWEEVAGVELEGAGYTELRMHGEVRPSALMLLNISGTGHLELIKFGTTLFGCEKFQPAVLFNNGPTSLGFAIVLEEGGEGEEVKSIGEAGNPRAQSQNITSLITASPNQGGIGPYEKVVINFCFHPSLSLLPTGWEREGDRAGMKEFVLFMHIVPITTIPAGRMIIDSQYVKQNQLTPLVEIGVTGKAMDVDVEVLPFKNFELGTCELGSTVQSIVTLQNNNTLPLAFEFTRIAHFHTLPMSGKLGPGKSVEVILSFLPSQFGAFSKKIQLKILGVGNYITDSSSTEGKEPSIIAQGKMKVLKETSIQVKGVCKVTKGRFMTEKALALTQQMEDMELSYAKKATHFDLYGSIRPSNDLKKQVTVFTKNQRYTYVDPDYAYTENEEASRQAHKDKYKNYIDGLRNVRVGEIKRSAPIPRTREEKEFDSEENIGMKPAAGLQPPAVTKRTKEQPGSPQHVHDKVLTTLELASRQATVGDMSVANNVINSSPQTSQEKTDCSKRLTPQQMHQIVIGPAVIEFGDVSLRTLNSKPLMIVNHLPINILIEVDIDCRELRQSLPLTQVIPPNSMSKVDIVFESQKTGPFQRSIVYTVNNHIKQHINVHANIVTPCLALSHSSLLLTPIIGTPHEDGCSGVVTVTNKTNGPAEFSWQPDKICPFAIRPSQGCIEPHGSLNCEVLYFPTVDSPLDGSFVLDVVEGNRLTLTCHAEFPSTTVQFTERRLTVGTLPLHVIHKVKAGIRNTGFHHAYFQVLNTQPTPFCTIKPESGCLPVGSIANLELTFFAVDVEKFDFKVDVKIRGNKKITLRVGGSVEPPLIECDVGTFAFHGVHVGATVSQQFVLFNPMSTEAEVEYNLSKYKDFELVLPNRNFADDDKKNYSKDNVHYIYMSPGEKVNITLKFSPKQVASYDFALPVLINDMIAPPPPMGKIPGTRSASVISQPLMASPCRRVTATAMFPVLDINKLSLDFTKSPYTLDLATPPPSPVDGFTFVNNGTEDASFLLDLSEYSDVFEQGVFRFSDAKGCPIDPPLREAGAEKWGTLKPAETMFIGVEFSPSTYCDYSLQIPVMLRGVTQYPYRMLSLSGLLSSPSLSFSTTDVVLSPIPLQITATAVIQLTATNYTCPLQIDVQIPKINADNGAEITPLSVKIESNPLSPCTKSNPSQTTNVVITFSSQTPVTFKTELLFNDGTGNRYPLSVTATADNCLLTNYPYIGAHPRHHLPEPPTTDSDVFQQYSPPTATPSTVSLASAHHLSAGTESGANYTPYSIPSHRDGARNAFRAYITPMKTHCMKEKVDEEEDEEEMEGEQEQFLHTVLCAAQRWVSHLGWANQPNPVMIPDTITDIVLLKKGTVTAQAGKMRSVFELVQHLCGRTIPGIPVNPPLATNAQERVKLLHWQLCTMLTFLRVQGAKLSHINAEWLLCPNDYLLWAHLYNYEANLPPQPEADLLNTHSKYASQAWIDLVLQMVKVFVLVKVRPSKDLTVSPDSYKSSVYSPQERTMLAWLSHHYQTQRTVIWPATPPSTRWIVSFDYDIVDGLVLASVLAAHCPFLIKTHFQDMYLKVSSPEECFHNALSVVHALRSIGIDYDVQPSDILQPNSVAMLLLCTHLYIYLPQYKPKATVSFEGALHQAIKKEVRIENPSTKAISYSISIIGQDANEFTVSPKSIQIGGHSHGVIGVTFMSCWLHPCNAMLMLVSRRTGSACGTTLLFQLQSVVNDIYPVSTVAVETPVYNTYKIPLIVTNPLTMGGTFKVILVESRGSPDTEKFAKIKGLTPDKPRSRKSKKDNSSTDGFYDPRKASVPHHSPCAFWCGDSILQLAAGGTATLNIHFLPLSPGPRHCALLFSCPGVGEFLQSIGGVGLLPEPLPLPPCKGPSAVRISSAIASRRQQMIGTGSDTVARFRCDPETALEENLLIPIENFQKKDALIRAAQYRMSDTEIRRRKLTGTLASASLASLDFVKHGQQLSQDTASDATSVKYSDEMYEVHIDSKYFEFPQQIEIPKNSEIATVGLPFKFKPDGQGFYPAKLLLVSSWDIRQYELEVTVTPSTTDAEIRFNAPTLQSITQDIPIINETQHDWNLSAEIEGDMYYGPPVVVAKAGCTTLYPLMFKPLHQGSLEGRLILTNVANGTVHQFRLMGTGLKPLPQETVVLTCHARQRATHTVYVHNPSERRKTFQAYTDLDCIVGNDEITIEGGISVPYEIIAFPRRQGHYKGSFSFESVSSPGDRERDTGSVCSASSEGHSVWYSVEVLADAPPPENTIDLLCEARKALTLELGIANPTDGDVEFDVTCEGEGLSGPSTVTVGPRAEASYKLLYSPTFIGTSTGKVTFLNAELGEFWYGLRLSAERPRPSPLPDMRAELGRSTSSVFTVRNGNEESSVVSITLSNNKHFILHSQNKVAVPGKGAVDLKITFVPSSLELGGSQTCLIEFSSPQLGEWSHTVNGQGLRPTVMDPMIVECPLGQSMQTILPFKNPLDKPLMVKATLLEKNKVEGKETLFALLCTSAELEVSAKGILELPFSFTPLNMLLGAAHMIVEVFEDGPLDGIKWQFPIKGCPLFKPSGGYNTPILSCKAKERAECFLECFVDTSTTRPAQTLPYPEASIREEPSELRDGWERNPAIEDFSYEIKGETNQSLSIVLNSSYLISQPGIHLLNFNVIFVPGKSFRKNITLIVNSKSGGKWEFPLTVHSQDPTPDDVIVIRATGLHKDSVIGMRLNSLSNESVDYEAYLSKDSDPDFRVYPSTGQLLPEATEGTLICVAYKPTLYGKTHKAKLIVQTADNQWSYVIQGQSPAFSVPVGVATTPLARPPLKTPGKRKNFVRENLKLKASSPSSPIKPIRPI